MFTNPHECGLYAYTIIISSLSAPGLVGCDKKVHIFFKKNPPVKSSGYGPVCFLDSEAITLTSVISEHHLFRSPETPAQFYFYEKLNCF